jgi:hypothetical protein
MPAGGCHPIRLDDLRARGIVGAGPLEGMPDATGAVMPTAAQLGAATTAIEDGWESIVGRTIR